MASEDAPRGIDAAPLSAWLADHLDAAVPPFSFELIAGGRSNLTYRVVDADGHAFALRRPPVSHVLATAHDVVREHRILSALAPAGLPVPTPRACCEDPAVNGAPFYVMDFVEGHVLRSTADSLELDVDVRRAIGPNLAQTLASLHAIDPVAVGLGDLGRHDAYVERQLKRWSSQLEQMTEPGETHADGVVALGRRLSEDIPVQQGVAIVHGDFRLDNLVLDDAGSVKAILDWELCTLGDPLADLGLLWIYWAPPGDVLAAGLGEISAAAAPEMSSRQELVAAYAAHSPLDLSALPYYQALGYWKLACILQGVYRRTLAGAGGGNDSSVSGFPKLIGLLAEAGSSALEEGA
jgi:aminoglycoside phosphotransferase (APT) family kinase protein